jgi:hypothetical protein
MFPNFNLVNVLEENESFGEIAIEIQGYRTSTVITT